MNIYLNLTWVDEQRVWNPVDYGDIKRVYIDPFEIWRPKLNLANSVKERAFLEQERSLMFIEHNGFVTWQPGASIHFYCSMDIWPLKIKRT